VCLTAETFSLFIAVMDEVAGIKVAGKIPNTLLQMLNSLSNNVLRSWQIYTDRHGVSVRIRYGHCSDMADGGCVDRDPTSRTTSTLAGHGDTVSTPTLPRPTAYCKKSPSQIKRDSGRRMLQSNKRRRTHSSDVEDARCIDVGCKTATLPDSPETLHISDYVMCDPGCEDTLTVLPVSPIKLSFGEIETSTMQDGEKIHECCMEEVPDIQDLAHIMDNSNIIMCPNCNEEMTSTSHICEELPEMASASHTCEISYFETDSNDQKVIASNDSGRPPTSSTSSSLPPQKPPEEERGMSDWLLRPDTQERIENLAKEACNTQ